ncbi:MAG: PH domain-containing protein [Myxococcota bacterium]|jgi:putative membrane protein
MTPQELAALEKRVHLIRRPEAALLTLYLIGALATLCAAPLVFIPLYFRYHTLWYRFDETGVSMGYGILFRRELQLTYARMQDIHLSQNILERWLGIGTVTVQTAGAGAAGNLTIVGVKDFNAIRDYLYAKMRGVRDEPHEEKATGADALLVEIRDALTDAAKALKEGR